MTKSLWRGKLSSSFREQELSLTTQISRFRPNIVVSGAAEGFDEDRWKEIRIGHKNDSHLISLVSRCTRCLVSICGLVKPYSVLNCTRSCPM